MKTCDHYVQLRKKHLRIFYNIHDSHTISDFDSRSNVFVIQLFGLMHPHDIRRLFRYLLTAFAAFPDRDYCLLAISVAQSMTPVLFEMLKYFIVSDEVITYDLRDFQKSCRDYKFSKFLAARYTSS